MDQRKKKNSVHNSTQRKNMVHTLLCSYKDSVAFTKWYHYAHYFILFYFILPIRLLYFKGSIYTKI